MSSETAITGQAAWVNQAADSTYQTWIQLNEPNPQDIPRLLAFNQRTGLTPLISIAMPVFNPPLPALRLALESLLAQTYPHWELCAVNAAPQNAAVNALLDEYAARDNRIHVQALAENLGIARNTNAAIAIAQGEYVALLDHDDALAPFALHEVVNALWLTLGEADFIYSDEDKLDQAGAVRFDPFFKPDFSPDLLRSMNYICHLLVLKRTLGDSIGWLQPGMDGAQDYDLVLRAAEKARRIYHIPHILYHWRVVPGSTAGALQAKSVGEASRLAVARHLERTQEPAELLPGRTPGWNRLQYPISGSGTLSVIIPNRDHADDLARCVNGIPRQVEGYTVEIVIAENGSCQPATQAFYAQLSQERRVKICTWTQPFNYSLINNFAVEHATGDVLLFLNNDIEAINDDWLARMLEHALRPQIGCVGAKLLYPDRTIQHAGIILGIGGVAGHSHKYFPAEADGYFGRLKVIQNVSAVTAACLMVRREVFTAVGGFNPDFQLAFGDVDLCVRIHNAGFRNLFTPYAELYHHESKTRGVEDTEEKKERFVREARCFTAKHAKLLSSGDPFYNPNLSLDHEDFSIDLLPNLRGKIRYQQLYIDNMTD
jgi:GT2 family glycosyltransferase